MIAPQPSIHLAASRSRLILATLVGALLFGFIALFSAALIAVELKSAGNATMLSVGIVSGAAVIPFLYGTFRNAREALYPGWIEVSVDGVEIRCWGKTKTFQWQNLSKPHLCHSKGKAIGCSFKILSTGKPMSLLSYTYDTRPEMLLGFLEAARAGNPVELQHVVPELKNVKRWPVSLGKAIVLWSCLWVLLIGGVGAIYVGLNIRDAELRKDLAKSGVIAMATISGRGSPIFTDNGGCGKGGGAAVRFTTPSHKVYTDCVHADDLLGSYVYYVWPTPPPETKVDVAYQADDPDWFVVAPNGIVPQRDVNGDWQMWGIETVILLAILIPGTSLVLYRQRRPKLV